MGFFDFLTEEIAIVLGTANTLIIHNDKVVVDSPSIVAIDQKSGKIIAVGKEANIFIGANVMRGAHCGGRPGLSDGIARIRLINGSLYFEALWGDCADRTMPHLCGFFSDQSRT